MSEAPGYAELRKALAEATPLPWRRLHDDPAGAGVAVVGDGAAFKLGMAAKLNDCQCGQVWSEPADAAVAYCDTRHLGEGPTGATRQANASLIVEAVNAAPSLLSERDGLRAALKEIEDKAALLALTHGHSGKLYEAFMALSIRASVALASAPNPPEAA